MEVFYDLNLAKHCMLATLAPSVLKTIDSCIKLGDVHL
jgi:hypothetical protein